jgi:hypothetical protein
VHKKCEMRSRPPLCGGARSETNQNIEIQNPKPRLACVVLNIRVYDFGFVSSFVLRISDLTTKPPSLSRAT